MILNGKETYLPVRRVNTFLVHISYHLTVIYRSNKR